MDKLINYDLINFTLFIDFFFEAVKSLPERLIQIVESGGHRLILVVVCILSVKRHPMCCYNN